MSYKKKYDLCVKTGSYESKGETKNRYKNVGLILENEEGKKMVMIDPTFNFAAVKREEGKDMIICSLMEPKDNNNQQTTTDQEE